MRAGALARLPEAASAVAMAAPVGATRGLSKCHIPPVKGATFEYFKGASFMRVDFGCSVEPARKPPKRGEIEGFTAASRRRMLDLMAKIDVQAVPRFVCLTYPDAFPLYSQEFKRHLEVLAARLLRRWPCASALWKLEFKERKSGENKGKVAPHYHLFVYGVPWEFPYRAERGANYRISVKDFAFPVVQVFEKAECREVVGGFGILGADQKREEETREPLDNVLQWVTRNWYDIVNSGDIRHFRAGTKVERLRTFRGAFAYAAKRYMSKDDMPELTCKPGRFWGVINRACLPLGPRCRASLTASQAVQIRRLFRRYVRANTRPEKRRWLCRYGGRGRELVSMKLYGRVDFWIERLPTLIGGLRL